MRKLKITDIFPEKSTISDKREVYEEAILFFRKKYDELLFLGSGINNNMSQPEKKYEIFILDIYGGKYILTDINFLPQGEDRDLYYDLDIANQIYQKLVDSKGNAISDYPIIKDTYEQEFRQIDDEILDLKEFDEKKFEKDMQAYILVSQTPLYTNYQKLFAERENILGEKDKLNKIIIEQNKKIQELSQELRVIKEKNEMLQKPRTIKEIIKELFIKK